MHTLRAPGEARVGRASAGVAVFVLAPRCGWGGVVRRGSPRRLGERESRGEPRPTLLRGANTVQWTVFSRERPSTLARAAGGGLAPTLRLLRLLTKALTRIVIQRESPIRHCNNPNGEDADVQMINVIDYSTESYPSLNVDIG
jgi:hypothetical protein